MRQDSSAKGQITRGSEQGTGGKENGTWDEGQATRDKPQLQPTVSKHKGQGTSTWGQRHGRLRWHLQVYRVGVAHGIPTGGEA